MAPQWATWLCIGALVAGTFDICYATGFSYLRSGVPPGRVLRFVASGLVGASAFNGGTSIAALGLALHFLIAFIVTTIFFAAAAALPSLTRRPIVIGALYGLVVYIVMNYVVLPLSRIGPRPAPPTAVWVSGVLVHMFLIGVPIALAARRAFQPPA
jgi:uncharacterized membrane protein YagU involved in acid resistance